MVVISKRDGTLPFDTTRFLLRRDTNAITNTLKQKCSHTSSNASSGTFIPRSLFCRNSLSTLLHGFFRVSFSEGLKVALRI